MLMTTGPGDLVLDPTCGSGTTAYVAEQWGRRWITIDTSRVALALARGRIMGARYDYYHLMDSAEGAEAEGERTGKPPPSDRTYGNDIRHGFVIEKARHVTLKSIANNAQIDLIWDRFQAEMEPLRAELNRLVTVSWEEWQVPREPQESWPGEARTVHASWWDLRRRRQAEIDDSMTRNAEEEPLYDKPIVKKGVVRVAGPFTVESLSPHRVLPADPDSPAALAMFDLDDRDAVADSVRHDFSNVVYEQIKAAGVHDKRTGQHIRFLWLKPFVSRRGYLQFEGLYEDPDGEQRRAALCIGPEYDTVGYELVKNAAREAKDLFDLLIVCGFSFTADVDESRFNFGDLRLLKARMDQDIRMGDRLKATKNVRLFVVYGEPEVKEHYLPDGMMQVEILGSDHIDPNTGKVESTLDPQEDIACWFVDDDYSGESFFVRQAYFLGKDPYDNLKRALKAEIDDAAWAELNSTISRAFPKPPSGRICVKVIDHHGEEVQKVIEIH